MIETLEFVQLLDRVTNAVKVLPDRAATLAVNFSKDRFRAGNWVNHSTEPWPKRKQGWVKDKRKGRALLVDSARLMRSIRKVRVTSNEAEIGTDVKYASVHNFGFRGQVNQKVRSFERRTKRGKTTVKAHTRIINQKIPRRQFIGTSAILDGQITRMMTAEITKSFK